MSGKTIKLVMIILLLYVTSNILSPREVKAHLYEENVVSCPVCGGEVKIFETLSMTVQGSYLDFQRKINGPYYSQLFSYCPGCHFSRYGTDFSNEVPEDIKQKVLTELKPIVSDDLDKFEFAAKIYIWERRAYEVIGRIYLFGSYHLKYWCEGDNKEIEPRRKRLQSFACEHYIKALEAKEIKAEDRGRISYLIGELYRRQGEFEKAITWYDRALQENNPDEFKDIINKQKEMARIQDANNNI